MLGFAIFCGLIGKVFCSPVLWPSGKYGLPMAKSGCPGAIGFSWTPGFIYQDLEDTGDNKTAISKNAHLQASDALNDVQQFFCMKTNKKTANDTDRKQWPAGEYCIYKQGSSCPAGMSSGSVLWDDENANGKNKNTNNGSLPAGIYNQDTKILFCCRYKGSYKKSIELPTEKPFYLIAYRPYCQEVLNTVHTKEYIVYDTEDDHNDDKTIFPYPFGAGQLNPRIYYCYYQAVKSTTASPPTVNNNKTMITTISSQTTTKLTTSWVNSSSALTSQEITKQNSKTPFSFTNTHTGRSKETFAISGKHISITATGHSTTEEARVVVRETRNEPEATGNAINVIIGLMISFIVVGGVVVGAVFYYCRRRHKNGRSHERFAVTFSTVGKAVTLDTEFRREEPNAYEEIKDKKNSLYGGGDGVNTYEEVKARENPIYNGSDDHNAANLKESNEPTYESMDDLLKWKQLQEAII